MTESVFVPTGNLFQLVSAMQNQEYSCKFFKLQKDWKAGDVFPTLKQANVAPFCHKAPFPRIVSLEESSDVT